MIQHVHRGSEQDTLIGLTSAPGNQFRQKCFANPRISDEHNVGSFGEEGEIEETQESWFGLHTALVVVEVKGVDTGLGLEAGAAEAALNGPLGAGFDLHVGKPLQGCRHAEILGGGFSQSGLQLAAYGGQIQLMQLLFEDGHHRIPFRDAG